MPDASLLPVALTMLATSLVAGLVSGLLGVGGGIVLVPVLEFALAFAGVPSDWRMHVAVATSSATIIPTSITSARAHYARGAVDMPLVRSWGPGILLGALAGSLLATQARSEWLTGLFGVAALAVSLKMLLAAGSADRPDRAPRGLPGAALAGAIGTVSAMMGIGGGAFGVTVMTLCGRPIHQAVATASGFGAAIAIPAALINVFTGWSVDGLPPWSVGYVNLPGFVMLALLTSLTAPIGARLAHRLDRVRLKQAFAVFLAITATNLLWEAR